MPAVYDDLDVAFDWSGDLLLGDDADIKHTGDDGLQSLLDQIHSVCASMFEDWEIYPNRGAGLDDFMGEPNTRYQGDRLHDRIRIALTGAGIVAEEDLQVRVVPVHIHKVLIIIRIDAVATPYNQLIEGELLQTAIVFDSVEQQVFFLDQVPELRAI